MKKKIITILIIVIIFASLLIINNKKTIEKNNKRYIKIKEDVVAEVERYTKVVKPICAVNDAELLITHKTLVYNGGFDKEKLLDVDNKSYCSVYAISGCDENEEYYYNVYIKCKNYKDNGFVKWDDPFPQKQ